MPSARRVFAAAELAVKVKEPRHARTGQSCDLVRDCRLLWVYCRECGRERDVDPAILPLPGDHPVPEVANRMKCSACGSQITTRPELYPGGIETMRTRWGGKPPSARP